MTEAPDTGGASDTLDEDIDVARAAVTAACAVPVVERIATGGPGSVATYGRGEVVRGVAVRRQHGALDVEVHVTVRASGTRNLVRAMGPVRRRVQQAIENVTALPVDHIDIMIDDLVFEGEEV